MRYLKVNADCTAFQFSPEGTCRMYNNGARTPKHPGLGSHSNTDSVTDDGTFCGLCAKGPEAEENWESKGFYCFNGKVSIHCHIKYIFI